MMRGLVAIIALAAAACEQIAGLGNVRAHSDAAVDSAPIIDTAEVSDGPPPACAGDVAMPPDEGADHSPDETALVWNANPPTSGPHYESWAAWGRTYTAQVKRGYWLHNIEHGGVVLLYNCTACQAEVDRLTAIMEEQPADPRCEPPVRYRMLVTSDSFLPPPVKFAAVAWGVSYTATCLNEAELRAFVTQHYNVTAPDDDCTDGSFEP